MRAKSIQMILSTVGHVGAICGLLAASALANASDTCTTATFQGAYGLTVNGVLSPAGGPGITIGGVQRIHSDGKGNLTASQALILNGVPLVDNPPSYFSPWTGTYTLNSDCTGLAFLTNIPSGGANFLWLSFVVDTGGFQIRMVAVPPYDSGGIPRVITSIGERVL
jgi:uncharacterized membrane protein